MSDNSGCSGCLIGLAGIWLGLWLFVHIMELCPRLAFISTIADGVKYIVSVCVYFFVLIAAHVMETIKYLMT